MSAFHILYSNKNKMKKKESGGDNKKVDFESRGKQAKKIMDQP